MQNSFWRGKSVLITGYEGFLGSWLTKDLLRRGADVIGLDILTRRKTTICTRAETARIKIITGSVENIFLLSNIIKKNQVEFIFHLAAKSLVGYCLNNPAKALSVNVRGTLNILEVSRKLTCVQGIIVASSDKAYGSHKNLPYKENFPLSGTAPYDVSKSCADLIAYMYFKTYGVPVCVTRCGNIYGPGDFNFSRIVPGAIRCAVSGRQLVIRSDGKFTRDYIYAEDIVKGYILLAEKLQTLHLAGEVFNFSNENPISVLKLIKKIYQGTNKKPDYKILEKAKHEIKHQYLSSKKARRVLGWRPKITLDEGLKKTVKWYRDYL